MPLTIVIIGLSCLLVPVVGTMLLAACYGALSKVNSDLCCGKTQRCTVWFFAAIAIAIGWAAPFGSLTLLLAVLVYVPLATAILGSGFGLAPVAASWAEVAYVAVQRYRRTARLRGDRCVHCNYDLRGTPSDRCPECGSTREGEPVTSNSRPGS